VWRRIARFVAPPDNPGAQLTGIVTIGALLAAESDFRRTTLPEAAGSMALAIVLVWLSHAYATSGEVRTGRAFLLALRHETPILWGAFVPLVLLLLLGAAGVGDGTAITDALIAAVALLVVVEAAASLRATGRLRPLQMAVSLAVGAGVFMVKLVVH
jgi:hypothetical protein